ncbi:MAG: magnesium transporter [Acidimicrobiia bacterium]|nr:magnesium transporter [Acidimicrobiia bacterium]
MLRTWRAVAARFRALVRSDAAGVRAGFVALAVSAVGSVVGGLALGSITGTLEELPGLLVLVPAAIGMRGNIFGALGSRLGTSIRTGTFRLSWRRDTLVGQNISASLVLSLAVALLLAIVAKVVAVGFGLENTISVADFVVISVVGGALSSVFVLLITVAVADLSVRRDWDLDNVAAPIVTTTGDIVTLPSLFVATYLVQVDWVTPTVAGLCVAAGVAALVAGLRSDLPVLRRIVAESIVVLALAGTIDVIAGLVIEKRLESFRAFPALLVLVPPFLGQAGSLGGILSSRVSTKLHLGLVTPARFSLRPVAEDVLLVAAYAVPVFLLVGVSADIVAAVVGLASPGTVDVVALALLAGGFTTALTMLVAYSTAVVTYRLGLDPDNHGIPAVTSTLDLLGSLALILCIVVLGLA